MARWSEAALHEQRSALIAEATGQPVAEVERIQAAYEQEPWVTIDLDDAAPYHLYGMPLVDRKTLYVLVWAYQPELCVETGTASGFSATATLSYLHACNCGRLYSIDVAGPHSDDYGVLIPQAFRDRLELRLQEHTPLLPGLLAELGEIDFFYHDSIHTVKHMRWEYELGWEYLKPGGCLASHDVLFTTAFDDFMKAHRDQIAGGGAIGNFGFVIKKGKKQR